MSDIIEVFAEKSKLNREQSEKVLAGTFAFLKVQLGGTNFQKILDEIPEAKSISSVFMGDTDLSKGPSAGMSGQIMEMMKMMTTLQKAGVSQDMLQKLTPAAFNVIGAKLSEETKILISTKMPIFKDLLDGKEGVKLPGMDSLMKPLFGKK